MKLLGDEGSEGGVMGLSSMSWLSISMAYSSALSCGGTSKPFETKNDCSEGSVP